MSKNIEIATKIVDKFGMKPLVIEERVQAEIIRKAKGDTPAKNLKEKRQTTYNVRVVGVLGLALNFSGATPEEARQAAIDHLAAELDEGNIVLSDTWEKDNLGAEDANSEETHSEE